MCIGSPDILALVDEFFWEHHVDFEPMNRAWHLAGYCRNMNDSLNMFSALRRAGIRAHSWT
jgi:hypothetical protein